MIENWLPKLCFQSQSNTLYLSLIHVWSDANVYTEDEKYPSINTAAVPQEL